MAGCLMFPERKSMLGASNRSVFCCLATLCSVPRVSRWLAVSFSLILGVAAVPTAAQSFFFQSLDEPNAVSRGLGIAPQTLAYGLNDSGTAVGQYSTGTAAFGAFEYSGGNFTDVSFPGVCANYSCGSEARGINNAGEVVGDYTDTSGNEHGYVLANGSYAIFDVPGQTYMQPNGINNLGEVVGIYEDANYVTHGFVYNGSFSSFDCPSGGSPFISGVNDVGVLVGSCFNYTNAALTFSFKLTPGAGGTLQGGSLTTIAFPGAYNTWAYGINNAGEIVGAYENPNDGAVHGFLL